MILEEYIPKLKHILKKISKQNSETELVELLNNCTFELEDHWNQKSFPNAFNLKIHLISVVYTKNYNNIGKYSAILKRRINDSEVILIDKLSIVPDYEKLQIKNSEIYAIVTEWQEINELQIKLLKDYERSNNSDDYRNLGNTSRTIMNKLALIVFNSEIHIPQDPTIKVHNGNFKNQLHTYIDSVLSGAKNKEFRKLAESAIEFVESSVDCMNITTHKLNAESHIAEMCVISTISGVNIIKIVYDLEKNQTLTTKNI